MLYGHILKYWHIKIYSWRDIMIVSFAIKWRGRMGAAVTYVIKIRSKLRCMTSVKSRSQLVHRFSSASRTSPSTRRIRTASLFWLPRRRVPAPTPLHRLFCCIFVVNHSPWPCATSSGPLHTTAHPSPCHPPALPVATHHTCYCFLKMQHAIWPHCHYLLSYVYLEL